MPTPDHTRLTFEGIFGTVLAPAEEWSFRLNLAPAGGTSVLGQAELDACVAAYTTHIGPKVKSVARLMRVKIADIDATGFYEGPAIFKDVDVPGQSSAGVNHPLSTALACTLLTARRGPTGRGRIFLPTPGLATLSSDGLIQAADAQSFATSVAAFVNALNGIANLGSVVVASSKNYLTPVTGVKVGRVPDVIRSRRSKVSEQYGATLGVTP